MRAVNRVGPSTASAASPSVTPATEPDAPTGLSATVGDQRVDLSWTAPTSNGGATILRYEYEQDGSGTWTSTGGTAPSYTGGCFRHQLLLPRPYLVLTKPLRLDIQCQRGASVKIG